MRITITIDVDGQGQVSINAGHETTEQQAPKAPMCACKQEAKEEPAPEAKVKPEPKAAPKPKAEPKPKAAPKAEPKQEPAPKPKAEPKPVAEPETEAAEAEVYEEDEVTLDDIRAAAKEKINTHREEIKAKLTELGATNVSNLAPEHYQDFYEFLACDLC